MSEQETATAPIPVVPVTASAAAPAWPELTPEHPLLQFHSRLATILSTADHSQIWGVTLSAATPPEFSTLLILQKYLRSVSGDVDAAAAALEKTLKWRKEFGLDKPEGEKREEFGSEFDGLGYVTNVKTSEGKDEVVTWNVYGAVKDFKATFGDLDRFLKWRVNLMEEAIAHLHLSATSTPIPDFSLTSPQADPHRIAQVHLYEGVSFLRMDPHVKAASKATIELMTAHYPELLSRKFFVGVPLVMSWMFQAVRMFVSAETARKFVVISYKTNLAAELGEKDGVPVDCGGTGPALAELQTALVKADPIQV
ncbi:phosphatidylinositol transfer protein SFH5, variant 2 [Cryptococcus amylolentus CBS 6039]|uniref:Phosphatidylinositol transfer protein SFH5 n=2 Tax=Cryptococcus amylolentus TaxID=104669 RepID=A0A1E3HF56_9TREE|nr:phosphatidylinositol transfer protein SFH5 [Cryptococcus amylolentus CBS 6039]XP_018990178.1 phosphatidylinositol transfer protein SFH5, variant 1 [Cryptococcus amylolentus CBS 6039]XP_018990179.1 phosphatidylinositol transfer protein SFH5, variant 2 [Cryptococcus amylolentus CBS 6039]ODO01409.1 phosphatidylinositol transfer protein SFH5 [Cryptococcus amylolentus CBS 6273]ODN74396.1 phosphatidylinositol transfer protein SFH5 [Cryptococcus amylolentus CBS 6039]ODN74397.1 phosphatidylinositol